MKALKILLVLSICYSGNMFASAKGANKPKTNKENSIEKTLPSAPNVVKMLIFNASRLNTKPDTAITNKIKPDFNGVILPENTLWFKPRD